MRVLIAGGAGFIGSNLAWRLVGEGHDVHAVDNLATGHPGNLPPQAGFTRADCASRGYLEAMRDGGWDLIVHFAGASSAPMFDDRPERAHQAVAAFQNSLELARVSDARVAFASTSSFYARCPKPFREDMAVVPGTLYEFSKLAMEGLARAYEMRYGLGCVAFRFFSVYGPRERHKGRFANIVSQFLWDLQEGRSPTVYGDGTQTRDFVHVDDLLDGILTAARDVKGFEVYNIGTGVEHTFNDVVRLLNATLGTAVPPRYVPNPVRNYVQETLADSGRLRALGWTPKVSLEEGIRRIALETPMPIVRRPRRARPRRRRVLAAQ